MCRFFKYYKWLLVCNIFKNGTITSAVWCIKLFFCNLNFGIFSCWTKQYTKNSTRFWILYPQSSQGREIYGINRPYTGFTAISETLPIYILHYKYKGDLQRPKVRVAVVRWQRSLQHTGWVWLVTLVTDLLEDLQTSSLQPTQCW